MRLPNSVVIVALFVAWAFQYGGLFMQIFGVTVLMAVLGYLAFGYFFLKKDDKESER